MNTYHAFYKNRQIELNAATSYAAQLAAAKLFKAKNSYEVTIALVALSGKQVTHCPSEL